VRRVISFVISIVLLAGACSSDSDGDAVGTGSERGDLAATLASAGAAVIEAGSARMTMTMEAAEISLVAEGVFDFVNQRGSLTMDMSAAVAGIPGDPGGFVIDTITDGTIIYMRMPFLAGLGVPGVSEDTWLRMDLESIGELSGLDLTQLTTLNQDPTQFLTYFESLVGEIDIVGTETIDGVDTIHYRGTVDMRAVLEAAGAVTDPAAFEELLDAIGSETQDIDAWIDDDGLLRQMKTTVPDGTGGVATIRITMSDYGTEVDIAPPAESVDFLDLMSGFGA